MLPQNMSNGISQASDHFKSGFQAGFNSIWKLVPDAIKPKLAQAAGISMLAAGEEPRPSDTTPGIPGGHPNGYPTPPPGFQYDETFGDRLVPINTTAGLRIGGGGGTRD